MAKKSDSKEVNPQQQAELSKNFLGSLMNGYKDTHYNFNIVPQQIISSGSLKLDNYIKIKSGTILRVGGPSETGKTSSSLLFARNYMQVFPKSKTIYINAEAKFGDEIRARTGLTYVTDAQEWNYGTVFILNSNCFDTICGILHGLWKQMNEAGEKLCCIVDSVDMLTLASSLEKDISANRKPAGVNFLTKELFRRLAHMISSYNGLLIMITQYSETFTMSQYDKESPSLMEGNKTHALNHMATYALYYRARATSHYILEKDGEKADPIKNPILGVNAKIDIRKSPTDNTGYTIEIPIKKSKVGNCVWIEKELFDTLFLLSLVSKKGAWIELSEIVGKWVEESNIPILKENERIKKENELKTDADKKPLLPLVECKLKHQGLMQFSEYFENNQPALNLLLEKIRELYS